MNPIEKALQVKRDIDETLAAQTVAQVHVDEQRRDMENYVLEAIVEMLSEGAPLIHATVDRRGDVVYLILGNPREEQHIKIALGNHPIKITIHYVYQKLGVLLERGICSPEDFEDAFGDFLGGVLSRLTRGSHG